MDKFKHISHIHSKEEAIGAWIGGYKLYYKDIGNIKNWMKKSSIYDNFYDLLIEKYNISYEELVDRFNMITIFE